MSQEKLSFRLYRYSCDYKDNRRNRAKKGRGNLFSITVVAGWREKGYRDGDCDRNNRAE